MITRREFLSRSALAGLGTVAGGCTVPEICRFVDDCRSKARVGVVANPEITWITEAGALKKALAYFRQQGVSAVVITGKLTKNGYRNQLEVLNKIWDEAFTGTNVQKICEDGNYSVAGFDFAVSRLPPVAAFDRLVFHGGNRAALTDDLRFYDRAYNAIYAGSLSGIDVQDGFTHLDAICENYTLPAKQGLLVNVHADEVEIRRLDFSQSAPPKETERILAHGEIYAEDLAEPFHLPRSGKPPLNDGVKPKFWADTQVQILPGYLGNLPIWTVRWPNLLKRHVGVRATSYEISAHLVENDGRLSPPFLRRYVLSDKFMLSEYRDAGWVSCVFRREELAAGNSQAMAVLSIVPISTLGIRGDAIRSPQFARG